ncbi:MAG: DivIVA domain-containing protein [Actinomycetota bacterium]|nr:DivIVA domain-containing protein [Actinomycetota bacterium]
MHFLFILIALAVLAAVALVAAGQGDRLAEPERDALPRGLPAGPLEPAALDEVRFPIVFRGYRMDDVDAVLDRVRGELADRDARIAELEAARPAGRRGEPS